MKKAENFSSKRKPPQRKFSFAADDDLIARIDSAARAARVGRSFVLREVLRGWVAEKRIGHDE
jgi:predicted transcriptional regulator